MSSKSDWSEWKTSNGTKVLYRNINIGVTNRIMAMYETQRQEVEQPYVEVTVGTKGNKTEKQVINPAYLKAHPEHQEEYDNYLAKIAEIDQAESDHITRIVLKSIKIPDEVNLEEWKETMEELYELEVPEDESDAQMMWLETVASQRWVMIWQT